MADKSLQFHSGIDNSEFVQKIEEMMKSIDKLSGVTKEDAQKIVQSLKTTTHSVNDVAVAYEQQAKSALSSVNKQRSARGIELALTKSVENAERTLQAAKQSMNVTYDQQIEKIRQIEQQYQLAQQYLEAWKNSENYDPVLYEKQAAELALLNTEIQKQYSIAEEAKNAIVAYGIESERAIAGAKQVIQQATAEQIENARVKKQAAQDEQRLNEISAMSNRELIQTYVNQRIAVRELEAEVKKGNSAKQEELATERASLEVISRTTFEKNKAMTMQRELLDLLMKENMATKEATAYKLELEKVVGEVGTAYRESTKMQTALTTGATQWGGVMSAVQGITGAFTAAQGVMGLFVEKNEDLVKIQTKVQSAMSITMGMSQVANTLHATSAFRVTTVTTVTRAWTRAQNALSASLGVSTGAAQAFMATITLGLSVAITALAIWITKLIDRLKKQKEEARALHEEMVEMNKKYAEQSARVRELTTALDSDNVSLKAKRQALKELKSLVPELTGSIDKQTGAVDYNREAVDKYVKSLRTEIEAEVLRGKIKEAISKQLNLIQDIEDKKNESLLGKSNRELRKWSSELLELELKAQAAADEIAKYEGQLTGLIATMLEGDSDAAARKAQQERLEEYKKTAENIAKEVEKLKDNLNDGTVSEILTQLEEEETKLNRTISEQQAKYLKMLKQGVDAEKAIRTGYSEWIINNTKDENEKRRLIVEKARRDELEKIKNEKAEYLKAYNLQELPAELQTVYTAMEQAINEFYDRQANEVSNDKRVLGFADLFDNIDNLSTKTLTGLINKAKEYLKSASGLTVEDIERTKQAIAKAEALIAGKNPFTSLLKAYQAYREARKAGEKGDSELAVLMAATDEIRNTMNETFSVVGEIGTRIGAEWTGVVDSISRSLNGVFDAISSDNLSGKISGIVSAVLYAFDALSDVINRKMLKNAETAASQVETIANRIKQIADEKGIGDSLFTDDMFNRVQQYGKAVDTALGQIQSSFAMFRQQQREHSETLGKSMWQEFDPLLGGTLEKAFNLSADKFKEQNAAAYQYLSTLSRINLTTAADIETALADLEAASRRTSSELGKAYLDQARTALEAALQYTQELEAAISEMVGDIGSQLLDVILEARREGMSGIAEIAGAINSSLEDIIANQLWASTMGKLFADFGEEITKAIASGDQAAIADAYALLFDGIIQKQGEFYTQLDNASAIAKAAGLSIFGINGNTEEELKASIDVMKTYLEGLQETLDSVNGDLLEQEINDLLLAAQQYEKLEKDRIGLMKEIEDLQKKEDAALQRNDTAAAEAYGAQIADKQRILGEILAEIEKAGTPDYERIKQLEEQLADYDYAVSNIDMVRQRIAEMEKQLDDYVGTLAYYDEKIAGINAEMKKLTAEELATEAGKARLAELKAEMKGFEDMRNALNEMIFGGDDKTASKVEGSIAWLNEEISRLNNELNNMSEADYYDPGKGGAKKAQIDEYNELLKTMTAFYEVQKGGDVDGSIDWLRAEIARLESLKSALSPEDLTGEAGAEYQKQIDTYAEQLKLLEDYHKAVEDKEKEQLEAALAEYETKESEKARIVKEYQDNINVLRKNGYEQEAQLAERALADYLSQTALAALEGTEEYEAIYKNLTEVSIEEARKALAAYREMIASNTELTAEQRDEVLAELDDIQKKIDELETTAAQKEFEELKKKVEDIQTAIESVASILQTFGAGNLATGLKGVSEMVGGIFSLVTALSSGGIASVLSAISVVITGLMTVIGAIRDAVGTQEYDTTGIERLAKEYDNLAKAANRAAGAERTAIREAQQQNINSRLAELQTLIKKEQAKEKYWWDLLGLFSSDADKAKIAEWQAEYDSLLELQQQLADDSQMQFLTTGFEEVSKSIAAIASDTTKTVEEMRQAVEQEVNSMMSNMIAEFLRVEMLEQPFKAAMAQLFSDSAGGKAINTDALIKFREDAIAMSEEYYEAIKPIFDVLGINNTSASAAGRQTIRSITEPQADMIVGRMHGMGITQTEMKDIEKGIGITLTEHLRLNQEMLSEVNAIRLNTDELPTISRVLTEIRNNNGLSGTGLGV